MLSIAMINPLVMLVVVTTLYQKRGGHCFFIFKSGVILGNTRFLIKNGVSDLTLPHTWGRDTNEKLHTPTVPHRHVLPPFQRLRSESDGQQRRKKRTDTTDTTALTPLSF